MPLPISVDILSDDDIDGVRRGNDDILTPTPTVPKRRRRTTESLPNPTNVLIIDDDPTPRKPATESTPSVVPETPMSGFSNSDVAIVKCNRGPTGYQPSTSDEKFSEPGRVTLLIHGICQECSGLIAPVSYSSGISRLICLESDSESANESGRKNCKENDKFTAFNVVKDSELSSRLIESVFPPEVTEHLSRNENLAQLSDDLPMHLMSSEDGILQVHDRHSEENGLDSIATHEFPSEEIDGLEPKENVLKQKYRNKVNSNKEKDMDGGAGKKRLTKEERICLKEEKKQQREQEKLRKAALQAEAAELKKLQKIKQKWEKGKFALKSIIAEIDTKVVELGSVGGHLLTRFAEKGVTYRICSNPIERSIVWNMSVPEEISQLSSNGIVIPYILLVFEAEEFCNLVTNESLMDHVSFVRSNYPSHTVCYVTNRLMAYIHKREHGQYKNPGNCSSWRRPPVEEVLMTLTTDFVRVHSRQCIDEAELAEHVVGLTCSLASCQFRKKLTQLSVYANGSLIPNDCIDKNLIKKNLWLKALVAIPKVQPRFAIAIWKKYPTMKSLLNVYLDPNKSVHEKEYLLQDLTVEGLLGEDRRLGEICSKRVYRILMAQCGSIKTDDVEDGADFFSHCVT